MGGRAEARFETFARAAHRAALAALCASAACCTQERLSSKERLSLATQPPPGKVRTVIEDDRDRVVPTLRLTAETVTRIPWGGGALPVVSPDGRHAAVEARSSATWAERVGDPLSPGGFDAQIEAVSLDPATPGAPESRLEGPWLLGRAADNRGFLVERPRPDGRRWIALAGWAGGTEPLAKDDWCNAHATIRADGALAWSRRPPEGGDWELVVRVGGSQRVVRAPRGSSWVLPAFSGDGRGVFALRLDGTTVSIGWIDLGDLGSPPSAPSDVTSAVPLTVRGGLSWAVRAMAPVGGQAASPPGSDRVALWIPEGPRAALWAPGADPEYLARGSLAALQVDQGNALVTTPEALLRHRAGSGNTDETLAAEPWFAQPPSVPGGLMPAFRVQGKTAEFARLTLLPAK